MEKTAQELFADARQSLISVGQHGILWGFDKAWQALRQEHRDEVQAALDKQAGELAAGKSVILHDEATGESVSIPVVPEPGPGQAGEGGGASSAAGSDDKSPLPDGVIA